MRILRPIGRNCEGMVDTTETRDLDCDIVARIIGLHRLVGGKAHTDDFSIGIEGAGDIGVDGTGLDNLGNEAVDEEEDKAGEHVIPEHDRGVVHDEAYKEDECACTMDVYEDWVDPAAELGQSHERHDHHSELLE